GTKGSCHTQDGGNRYQIKGATNWAHKGPNNAPYVQEHTDLIKCIREGKPINELKNVAESTLTAIMGRMAAYTGKTVTWDKALNSEMDTFPNRLTWDMNISIPAVAIPGKTALV